MKKSQISCRPLPRLDTIKPSRPCEKSADAEDGHLPPCRGPRPRAIAGPSRTSRRPARDQPRHLPPGAPAVRACRVAACSHADRVAVARADQCRRPSPAPEKQSGRRSKNTWTAKGCTKTKDCCRKPGPLWSSPATRRALIELLLLEVRRRRISPPFNSPLRLKIT